MKTIIWKSLVLFCLFHWAARMAAQCAFTPTVTGDLLVCPQGAVTLGTQPYAAYQWYRRAYPNGAAEPIAGATGATYPVDYNQTPVYISVAATQDGCTEQSAEVLVDGLAFLPVLVQSVGEFDISVEGEQLLCAGDTIFQIALPPYTTNFQWYNGQDPIPGATDDTLAVTEPGYYWLTASPGECPNFVASLGLQIPVVWSPAPGCTTGTEEPVPPLDATIMPNPAQASLLVAVDALESVRLTLFDLSGKRLRELEFKVAVELFTGDLPAGLYNLTLQTAQACTSRKVVLQ
ncbi:MAG: T9SS type A sorting domain-containing protein [Saprospiraceae bacterium]|nr:T9SS type A sorting domain-containing protein [Saprospiraceae bacterium]